MGYEVAGGLGVKMAAPDREVYVMVGDGSWLMMSSEIVTAVQEGFKLTVVLIDNHGFASIGGLSAVAGLGRLRHRVPLPHAGRQARRRAPAGRPGGERRQPRRVRVPGGHHEELEAALPRQGGWIAPW